MTKKRRWLKIVLALVAVAIVLVVVGVTMLYLSLGKVVKTGVETFGSQALQAPVTVTNITFSAFTGKAEIEGLVVGNPQGFKTDSAFKLGVTRVVVDPKSIMTDTIVIREILIEAPEVTYETDLKGSNITRLKENIEAFTGTGATEPGDEPAEEPADKPAEEPNAEDGKPGKKVVIESFKIADGQIRLSATVLGGAALPVPLPEVHLTDIGKDSGGTSIGEAVSEIFGSVTGTITGAVKAGGALIGDTTDAVKDTAEQTGKAVKDVGKSLKETTSGTINGIKGIFGKKKEE